jgi:Spy/CpxP family protein refolding chaperone
MNALNYTFRAATAAALATGLVFAQASGQTGAPAHRSDHGKPGGRSAVRRKLMAGYLGLTDQQKTQAQTIFSNARESAKPVKEQLRQVRTDLRSAIRDGKPVDQLAATEGSLVGKLAAIRAAAAVQFRALLTPEQLQKLQDLHQPQG